MLRLGEELRAAVKTNAMTDLCDPKEGTMIFHATSTDESNPPEAMIDGYVLHYYQPQYKYEIN